MFINVQYFIGIYSPHNSVISIGESFTMTCNPDNYAFTMYRWTRESELLPNTTATLTVNYTDGLSPAAIGGQYKCFADDLVERSFQVGLAPYITLPPMNIYTMVGDDAVFDCEAVGFPTPNISWMHDKTNYSLSSTETAINNTVHSNCATFK